ncbi:MAG: DUF4272 domain-containing protein [Polyangiaceae bacterium]|nr:DUF4272 domain-containing protein [Polyangiaceae bacterium]
MRRKRAPRHLGSVYRSLVVFRAMLLNAYATHRTPPPLSFPHQLVSSAMRAELGEHLHGFCGYIFSRGKEQMDQRKFHLIQHVQRVQHQFAFEVEEAALDAVAAWAAEANAILFSTDGAILAPDGRVLLGANGKFDEEAREPYPEDAGKRYQRSHQQLSELQIRVPASLPPVIGECEVLLREPAAVHERCMGLAAVAIRAETALSSPPLVQAAELFEMVPGSEQALTPNERAFVETQQPSQHDATQFLWRYEGLYVLLWATGAFEDLHFPEGICDVPGCVRALKGSKPPQRLRPAAQILDALDLHYRLHWATTDARVRGTELDADLDPGVVFERHYALNWLTRFQDADWDDVETPT